MADDGDGKREVSRRTFIRAGAAGTGLLAAGSLLSACGIDSGGSSTDSSGFTTGPPKGGTPKRGGTLRVGLITGGSAETINPRAAVSNPDIARCYSLYDNLFKSTPGGGYAPGLAVEASSNKDATLWKLKLRKGVIWHNGKPFTADDVVYTIKASWGSADNAVHPGLAPFIDFKGARKLDAYTVEVPLLRGLAEFPQICTQWSVVIVQDGTTNWNAGIGTGPYKFVSFIPGTRSVFAANPHYWQSGTPYVDELVIDSSYSAADAQLSALLAGAIHIAPGLLQPLAKAYAKTGLIILGNQPAPGFIAPTMHITKPPFTDVRVRQALRLLADRQTSVADALDGFGTPGNDCAGKTLRYWASDLRRSPDPERARFLLKQAGHEKLTLELVTADLIGGVNPLAILFAEQARAGGVTIKVKTVDPNTYYTPASPGGAYPNKPFSMNQWTNGQPCLSYTYLTADLPGAPYNEQGWGGKADDEVLYAAMAETDPVKAHAKWQDVQHLQFERGGYIIMANITNLDGYSKKVRGVQTTSTGSCDNYDFSGGWLA